MKRWIGATWFPSAICRRLIRRFQIDAGIIGSKEIMKSNAHKLPERTGIQTQLMEDVRVLKNGGVGVVLKASVQGAV